MSFMTSLWTPPGLKVTKAHTMTTDNLDLFSVVGKNMITMLTGEVTTIIATTTTYVMRVKTTNEPIFSATTITTAAAGTMYLFGGDCTIALNNAGTITTRVASLDTSGPLSPIVVGKTSGTAITIESDLNATGTGTIRWDMWWWPLEAGASIVAL